MVAPRRYAEGTSVAAETSRADIERLLIRHGATGFMAAWGDSDDGSRTAVIQFRLKDRMLRYAVSMPEPNDFRLSPGGRHRNMDQRVAAADQEYRRRWRALHLIIKAKLEIVASGDSSFDREFLADIMLPDGGTVGSRLLPQVESAYKTGQMPPLLGSGS